MEVADRQNTRALEFDALVRSAARRFDLELAVARVEVWCAWCQPNRDSELASFVASETASWDRDDAWSVDLDANTLAMVRSVCELACSAGLTVGSTVIDPCLGDGRVVACLAAEFGHDPTAIWGAEPRDAVLVEIARQRIRCATGSDSQNCVVGDVVTRAGVQQIRLFESASPQARLFEHAPETFGFVVSLPRTIGLDTLQRDALRRRYRFTEGPFTLEGPLVERGLELLAPGGTLVLAIRAPFFRRGYGERMLEDALRSLHITDLVLLPGTPSRLVIVACPGSPPSSPVILHRAIHERARGLVNRAVAGQLRSGFSTPTPRTLDEVLPTLRGDSIQQVERAMKPHVSGTLRDLWEGSPGRTTACGLLDIWLADRHLTEFTRELIGAEEVVDWTIKTGRPVMWPYQSPGHVVDTLPEALEHRLSPFEGVLKSRKIFGRPIGETRHYYEHLEHYPQRLEFEHAVTVAAYGTHVNAAYVRGARAFSRSAPVFGVSSVEDAFLVLGLLNSSFGTFWLRHHAFVNASGALELTLRDIGAVPRPTRQAEIIALSRRLDRLARSLSTRESALALPTLRQAIELWRTHTAADQQILDRMRQTQDELDYAVAEAFGLLKNTFDRTGDRSDWYAHARESDPCFDALEREEFKRGWSDSIESETAFTQRYTRNILMQWAENDAPLVFSARAAIAALKSRLGTGDQILTVLRADSVEANPWRLLSDAGLERLERHQKRSADPHVRDHEFSREDFAGPLSSLAERDQAFFWRGRFHIPREPFMRLGELSDSLGEDMFGYRWAQASKRAEVHLEAAQISRTRSFFPPGSTTLDPRLWGVIGAAWAELDAIRRTEGEDREHHVRDAVRASMHAISVRELSTAYRRWLVSERAIRAEASGQLDLARMVELEAVFASHSPHGATLVEVAEELYARGWRFVQVRWSHDALIASGKIRASASDPDRWRLV